MRGTVSHPGRGVFLQVKKSQKFHFGPLHAQNTAAIHPLVFRRSSAVEQLTVNQLVVGSIPTAGAINN